MNNLQKLKFNAISGVAWNAFGRISTQVIGYLFTFVLIRILLPGDFGLMAILLLFIGFMGILLDFGLGATIVQSQVITEKEINTIATLNLMVGIFLMLLFCFSASNIATFFKEPVLESLIYVISIGFGLNALSIVPRNLHIKKLLFKRVSIIELFSVGVSGLIAIWMALNGYGVWSLVFQYICKVVIETFLYFAYSIQIPRLSFSFLAIKSHLKFSSTIFGSAMILHVADSLDSLLIGRVFNKSQLGFYNKSMMTSRMPTKMISSILTRVMFPSFSKIQNDVKRISNGFIKIHKLVIALTLPSMLLIAFYAEHIILLVAGEKWSPAIPIVQIFAIAGIARSIIALLGPVVLSLKLEKYIWRSALYKNGLLIIGTLIGINWGIKGVAIGKTVADFVFLIVFFHYIHLILKLPFKQIIQSLQKVFIAAFIMLAFFFTLSFFINWQSLNIELFIGAAGGLGIYFLVLFWLKEKGIDFMKEVFLQLFYRKQND